MGRDIVIDDFKALASARETVREIGKTAGFGIEELRPVLNIVSQLGLYGIENRCACSLTLNEVSHPEGGGICVMARIPESIGAGDSGANLSMPDLALSGMRRLSDQFEVSHGVGEMLIHAIKWRAASASS